MKEYKKYAGPRTSRRRLRRRLKTVILPAVILALALISAPTRPRSQAVAATPEPSWARPTKSNLAYARNLYRLNGANGEALIYLERWEEFVAYIVGEKDVEELAELPDGTVVLPSENEEVQR